MYFPSQSGSQHTTSGLTVPADSTSYGPRPFGSSALGRTVPSERIRSSFAGSALEREFDAFGLKNTMPSYGEPGQRRVGLGTGHTSPYGVPAHRKPLASRPTALAKSDVKPFQHRSRAGPRTRFPQNFPHPPRRPSAPRSSPHIVTGGPTSTKVQPLRTADVEHKGHRNIHVHGPNDPEFGGAVAVVDERSSENELHTRSAMQELEELKGSMAMDSRDSWRFEQARRPGTAPGPSHLPTAMISSLSQDSSSQGNGTELRSASAPCEESNGETESELRVRLATAESVMRKLYRKTNDLQERLSAAGSCTTADQISDAACRVDDEEVDSGTRTCGATDSAPSSSYEREQALYLLQQKEADLQRMRDYTSQLASRLEHLAEQQRGAMRPSTSGDGRNGEYRERYMRMRTEYRQLLRSRTDSVRRSSQLSSEKEHGVLIEQLDTALREEAELHRKESQRLNEELYLQEKQACDWYVEKRLLQDRLQALEHEIGQRDQLEGEIDGKMLALFSRLKALEDANLRLEQDNEGLRNRAGMDA